MRRQSPGVAANAPSDRTLSDVGTPGDLTPTKLATESGAMLKPDPRPLPEVLDAAGWPDPTREPSDPSLADDHVARTLKLLRFLIREVKPYQGLFAFHHRRDELRTHFAELVKLEHDINAERIRRACASEEAILAKRIGGAA